MDSNGLKWKKNIILRGELEVLTGLHIGGAGEYLKIGGVDSPVIRAPVFIQETGECQYLPIIPGSSLKGKMRSLLDLAYGHIDTKNKDRIGETKTDCLENGDDCLICKVFGHPASEKVKVKDAPTRLIVRDAVPTLETIKWWNQQDEIVEGGEIKAENSINRILSRANPRFIERVPAGSKFKVEFVLRIYEGDDEQKIENLVREAIKRLNDDYLGGHGTRGYGKVKITITEREEKTEENYSP